MDVSVDMLMFVFAKAILNLRVDKCILHSPQVMKDGKECLGEACGPTSRGSRYVL